MSLILKSNNTASKFLFGSSGIFTNQRFEFLADFSTNTYQKGSGEAVPLKEVLTTARATTANIFNEDGSSLKVEADQPRIGYNPANKTSGLVMESKGLSYVFDAPKTGAITIGNTLPIDFFVVKIEGTGSVDISSPDIVAKYGKATSNSIMYFKSNKKGTLSDVTMTVTGDVSRVSISTTMNFPANNTSYLGAVTNGRTKDERNTLNLSGKMTGGNDYTIFVKFTPNFHDKEAFVSLESTKTSAVLPILSFQQAGRLESGVTLDDKIAIEFGGVFYRDYYSDEIFVNYVVGTKTVKQVKFMDYDINKPLYLALSCTPDGFRIAFNGQCSELLTGLPPVNLSEIDFGLTSKFGDQVRPNGTFNKAAVFNKSMTRNELEQLTLKSI